MRGIIYKDRKIRLLAVMVVLFMVYILGFSQSHWVREFAENKVEEFMGHKLSVEIGHISGGLFRDMTLQDVAFYVGKGEESKVFRLERMEISYRLWSAMMEKAGLTFGEGHPLNYIGMYFSKENPFVRGSHVIFKYIE